MSENYRPEFREYIGRWNEELQRVWRAVPEKQRQELVRLIGVLPGDAKTWRGLLDQAASHARVALGDKHAVAIIGHANVGKSTLYNQLVRNRGERARVSAVPGTTRQAQQADAGVFSIVDTPGADAVGAVGETERQKAFDAARSADMLLLLLDAGHGVREPEQQLFNRLRVLEKPMVVALNKMDLVRGERAAVLAKAAADLGVTTDQLIPITARSGTGVERLLMAIAKSEPGIIAALGAALPEYRWKLSQTVIGRAASTAAAIAITPLPIIDFIPLLGVQAAMVLGIARIYAYRITLARARELVVTFGLGVLGRTVFYELSKFGGPPGWLVAAAVASGTTAAMGYAAAVWFERGERLSSDALGRIARAISGVVVERLKSLGRRRPGRLTLRQQVNQALGELPEFKEVGLPRSESPADGSPSEL
jgi:GTP-binding protein Era